MSDTCQCVTLVKLGGPIHASGKDYYCTLCGKQFKVEEFKIGVQMGSITSDSLSVRPKELGDVQTLRKNY